MAQSGSGSIILGKADYVENKENPIFEYVVKNSLREPEVLTRLKQATFDFKKGVRMMGDPLEAQLLRVLLRQMNAKKVIEVGIYTGFNTLSFALSIPDDGKVVACDITDEYVNAVGKKFFQEAGVEKKIDLKIQAAVKTLDELIANGESGTYDFVFIDADKHGYDSYYEKCLVLLRKGGIIAIDNVIWGGRVAADPSSMDEDTLAIHNLNVKVHKDSRVDMVMLPFADGVTLAVKL